MTMHGEHLFCMTIVGLHFFVADWPGRGNAFFVFNVGEIFLSQPRKSRSVNLCVSADKVMDARAKWTAALVKPLLFWLVSCLSKDRLRS